MGEIQARTQAKTDLIGFIDSNDEFSAQQKALLKINANGGSVPAQVMKQVFSTGNETADSLIHELIKGTFSLGTPTPEGMENLFARIDEIKTKFVNQAPEGTAKNAIVDPSTLATADKTYNALEQPGTVKNKREALAILLDESMWEPDENLEARLNFLLESGKIKRSWIPILRPQFHDAIRGGDLDFESLVDDAFSPLPRKPVSIPTPQSPVGRLGERL